jgi:hypothetical protein
MSSDDESGPPVAALAPALTVASVPLAPSITSPPAGTVSLSGTFSAAGTAIPGVAQVVTVTALGPDSEVLGGCSDSISDLETTWSCTLNLESSLGFYEGAVDITLVASSMEDTESEEPSSPNSNTVDMRFDPDVEAAFTNYDSFSNDFVEPVTLEGTGPAHGSVQVNAVYYPYVPTYGGETTTAFCLSNIDAGGFWSCTGGLLANGGAGYYAYVYFEVFSTDYFGVDAGDGYNDEIGGDVLPSAPSLQYSLSSATIALTAIGVDGADISVELYTAQPNGEGYNYDLVDSCGYEGEGEGGEGGFYPEFAPAAASIDCSFSGLEPGIWNTYFRQIVDGTPSDWAEDFILIPESPTLTAPTVNANRTVRLSGSGTPGFRVNVVRGAASTPACDAIVTEAGTWACTATPPAGTASFRAIQQSVGFVADPGYEFGTSYNGFSAASAVRSVTVPAAPTAPAPAPPPTTPQAPATPAAPPTTPQAPATPVTPGVVQVTGLPSEASAGSTLEIAGNTDCVLPVVCDVDVDIFSDPLRLGSTVTKPAGDFSLLVAVPKDFAPGEHTIVVTVTPRGGIASSVSQPITIAPPVETALSGGETPAEVEAVEPEPTTGAGSGRPAGDRDSAATASALTDSLPTFRDIFREPLVLLAAGGLAIAILLLVVFPTELLNATLSSNTGRFGRGFAAIEVAIDRGTEWFTGLARSTAIPALLLVLLTSIIFGFVDPEFGFDLVSVRLVLSLAIGLFIVTYVASWISGAIIKRTWGIPSTISLQPVALVFAVVGVVVARLIDFSPGFLVGLVIGLELLSKVGSVHRTRALVVQLGTVAALAMLAWFGYVFVAESVSQLDFGTALLLDTLAATTAEGLTAVAVAILPLGFLEGREIFAKSKRLWLALFLVFATLFALIILPTAAGDAPLEQILPWVLVLAVFAAVVFLLWAVLHFTAPPREADDDEVEAERPPVRSSGR